MKTIMKWTAIVLAGLIGLMILASVALYPIGMERLTRSYPGIAVETVKIPTDADAIAQGKHIAVVWACTKCHGENLGGSLLADDPFLGTIYASNLTSGRGGIAESYTDTDWVRAIRHGVKPDARIEIFMYDYYSTMSDRDLGDLIAYLKQLPPVNSDYPAMNFGPLSAVARAIGLFTPMAEFIDHGAARPAGPVPGATEEYGSYLAVLCSKCHNKNFGGKLAKWTGKDFVRAVRTGVLADGKRLGPTMSANTFREMNETELSALWLYFQRQSTLPAPK